MKQTSQGEIIMSWFGRITGIGILLAGLSVGYVYLFSADSESDISAMEDPLTYSVTRLDFEAFVTETGDVASASNREVRCEVEARGAPGTTILKIVEEGTMVQTGDFIVMFDSSALENNETAQRIVVANNRANLIQVESQLANAERTLVEFEKGLFEQEVTLIESEVFVAQEGVERSLAKLLHSQRLAAKGFTSIEQLRGDQFQHEKAKRDLTATSLKLNVYREFTKERLTGEYNAAIKQKTAQLDAAQSTLDLSTNRLADIQEQIVKCQVLAPSDGQVVYANDERRSIVIEEGAIIRDNQIVVRLPDIKNMEVAVRINESHINRIQSGQSARIELDADPDNPLEGKVHKVAAYPFPMRWHGAPLEYDTKVTITNPPSTLRPGLRAKVKIYFEAQAGVLQVPLASVIEHDESHYCLVLKDTGWETRRVNIGTNNNTHVVIENGISEGEVVTLTPFRFIQRSELDDQNNALHPVQTSVSAKKVGTVSNVPVPENASGS
jgi:HlyD family secretion protein